MTISDAFNKGYLLATGDVIIYMNGGDEFYGPNALSEIMTEWSRDSFDWIIGSGLSLAEDGQPLIERTYGSGSIEPRSLVQYSVSVPSSGSL